MADRATVIGPETRISGEIRGDEDLVVRGRVDGRIQLGETLTIEDGGVVQADVEVKSLVVAGVLVGSIVASESVRLTERARVVGDVTAPRFVMEAGAAFRGRVEMGEGEARADKRRSAAAERPEASAAPAARPAPPRLAPPPRVATPASNTMRAPGPPAAPPRVAAAPAPRPTLPRPEVAASAASGPAWAKKKLKRR